MIIAGVDISEGNRPIEGIELQSDQTYEREAQLLQSEMARKGASSCFGYTWGVNEIGLLQIAGSSLCISIG
jgi:hypothetical protein